MDCTDSSTRLLAYAPCHTAMKAGGTLHGKTIILAKCIEEGFESDYYEL
jgi:hypothetical protein